MPNKIKGLFNKARVNTVDHETLRAEWHKAVAEFIGEEVTAKSQALVRSFGYTDVTARDKTVGDLILATNVHGLKNSRIWDRILKADSQVASSLYKSALTATLKDHRQNLPVRRQELVEHLEWAYTYACN